MERFEVAFLVSLGLTFLAIPIILKILRRLGSIDQPNERSSHVVPTPRGAGFAQAVGGGAALASSGGLPLSGLVALAGFGAVGAVDDLRAQPPLLRLALQCGVAIAAVALAMSSWNTAEWPVLVVAPIAVVTFVGLVNATNFMDGINGLSVAHGVIFGIVYGVILWRAGLPQWTVLAATMAGVSLAVLPWNWGPLAKIFLGDSGSYLLGASVALLLLTTWFLGPGPLVAVAPVTIYVVDTFSTLIRRFWRHESLTSAHREHVYQRLVRSGWSHPRTALFVAAFSLLAGTNALAVQYGVFSSLMGVLLLVALSVAYLAYPSFVNVGAK